MSASLSCLTSDLLPPTSVLKRGQLIAGLVVALLLASPGWTAVGESVVDTPHNLSVTGPGPVRSLSESEVCVFCHTPHRAGVNPLWNRSLSEAVYITYKSATARAAPGQPTGSSKLCLSCHDGTIALNRTITRPMQASLSMADHPRGRKNLGTDLSDDHPVSMSYRNAASANPRRYRAQPLATGQSLLDENDEVQCTSCHDPHNNQHGDFLVQDNREGRLCLSCHTIQEWTQSSHSRSTARWKGAGRDPWPHSAYPDVRSNACANCHSMHDAGGAEYLLYHESQAQTCYNCHDGSVASKDLRADFEKPFRHRVEATATRASTSPGRDFDVTQVGCNDCHNPHAANETESIKPTVSGALEYVVGVSSSGGIVERARFEYEVCYKCHSFAAHRDIARPIRRLRTQSSLREEFNRSAVSYHPVEAVGRNPDVPSLIPPLSETSLIACTDCHSNDADGGGPARVRGPHGSRYRYLLVRRYETSDQVSESPEAYALCYGCHDRLNILSDRSFPEHSSHVLQQRASCSLCHDAHGISRSEGTPTNNAHLMNFDVRVVRPDTVTGRLEYVSEGFRAGACFLNCHGVDHSPKSY